MSASKTQGLGFSSGRSGRRNLSTVLAQERQSGSSIRYGVYVSNNGNGTHMVKNQCNDAAYPVKELNPGLSLLAGQQVTLGSYAGTPGEVILGSAPAGRASSGLIPAVAVSLTARYTSLKEIAAVCPSPIMGRSYVCVSPQQGGGGGEDPLPIYRELWHYIDGIYQSTIATTGDYVGWVRASATKLVALSAPNAIATVTIADGSAAVATVGFVSQIGGPVVIGGFIYFSESNSGTEVTDYFQLHRVPLGASGDVDDASTRIGPRYSPADLQAPPAFNGYADGSVDFDGTVGSAEAIPALAGGSWVPGTDRLKVSPGLVYSPGYPAGTALSVHDGGGEGPIAVQKRGDEQHIIPPDWRGDIWLGTFGDGPHCKVSPSGNEIVCYPLAPIGDDGVLPTLCRLRVEAIEKIGCAIPQVEVHPGPGDVHNYPDFFIPMDF